MTKQQAPFHCIGIFGRVFGHKFNNSKFGTETFKDTNFCTRCGMPMGGWKNVT